MLPWIVLHSLSSGLVLQHHSDNSLSFIIFGATWVSHRGSNQSCDLWQELSLLSRLIVLFYPILSFLLLYRRTLCLDLFDRLTCLIVWLGLPLCADLTSRAQACGNYFFCFGPDKGLVDVVESCWFGMSAFPQEILFMRPSHSVSVFSLKAPAAIRGTSNYIMRYFQYAWMRI